MRSLSMSSSCSCAFPKSLFVLTVSHLCTDVQRDTKLACRHYHPRLQVAVPLSAIKLAISGKCGQERWCGDQRSRQVHHLNRDAIRQWEWVGKIAISHGTSLPSIRTWSHQTMTHLRQVRCVCAVNASWQFGIFYEYCRQPPGFGH